jgi:hypothetical protein
MELPKIDDVMLAYAETADLESWKDQQRMNGSLSVQKLCERARNIEALIRQGRSSPNRSSPFQLAEISHRDTPVNIPRASPSSTSPVSFEHSPTRYSPSRQADSLEPQVLVADVFRHGALLFLATVVNDHWPRM